MQPGALARQAGCGGGGERRLAAAAAQLGGQVARPGAHEVQQLPRRVLRWGKGPGLEASGPGRRGTAGGGCSLGRLLALTEH